MTRKSSIEILQTALLVEPWNAFDRIVSVLTLPAFVYLKVSCVYGYDGFSRILYVLEKRLMLSQEENEESLQNHSHDVGLGKLKKVNEMTWRVCHPLEHK